MCLLVLFGLLLIVLDLSRMVSFSILLSMEIQVVLLRYFIIYLFCC